MERVPVFALRTQTTEEVLALKIAGGATLEGLGDPSDSHKDFDMALYVVERQRLQEEQIKIQNKRSSTPLKPRRPI